jgi:hypothetical protein
VTPKQVDATIWAGQRVVAVACGIRHTAAVVNDGSIFTFGCSNDGLLGHCDVEICLVPTRVPDPDAAPGEPPAFFVGITFSETHTAAWTADGRVFCWGKTAGVHGELGSAASTAPGGVHAMAALTTTTTAPSAAAVNALLRPREIAGLPKRAAHHWCHKRGCEGRCDDHVVDIVWGNDHSTYARTARGRLFAWGRGIGGQLGLGATERDHDAPRLMGPVQGRFVSGVFPTHDGTVWLTFGGAENVAQQPASSTSGDGGLVANPIVALRVGASDDGAGSAACV